MNLFPSADQLSHVMSEATAPAFVLGAVAAFVAVLLGRMSMILDRVRSLNEIAPEDSRRSHLKTDIPRLRRRIKLLSNATYLALLAAICTSLLMVLAFASAFFGLRHEYGAGVLFSVAIGLLGGSLFRFGQEVKMGLSDADHYQ